MPSPERAYQIKWNFVAGNINSAVKMRGCGRVYLDKLLGEVNQEKLPKEYFQVRGMLETPETLWGNCLPDQTRFSCQALHF